MHDDGLDLALSICRLEMPERYGSVVLLLSSVCKPLISAVLVEIN